MAEITTVQRVPSPEPSAWITTGEPDRNEAPDAAVSSLTKLMMFADQNGDISDLLEPSQLTELGVKAVREWTLDDGSRAGWKEDAERYLRYAAQERNDDEEREPIWEEGANIHFPILITASQQFAARAYPELVKGDKVV